MYDIIGACTELWIEAGGIKVSECHPNILCSSVESVWITTLILQGRIFHKCNFLAMNKFISFHNREYVQIFTTNSNHCWITVLTIGCCPDQSPFNYICSYGSVY